MKFIQPPTVGLFILLALLAMSNPSKRDYVEQLVWTFQSTTCRQQQQSLSVRSVCSAIAVLPHDTAADLIAGYSQRQNFLFFSLYTTNFLGLEDRSVGVAKLFLPQPVHSFQQKLSDIADYWGE